MQCMVFGIFCSHWPTQGWTLYEKHLLVECNATLQHHQYQQKQNITSFIKEGPLYLIVLDWIGCAVARCIWSNKLWTWYIVLWRLLKLTSWSMSICCGNIPVNLQSTILSHWNDIGLICSLFVFRHLIRCLVDSGKMEDAASFAKVTEEFIKTHTPHLYPRLFTLLVNSISLWLTKRVKDCVVAFIWGVNISNKMNDHVSPKCTFWRALL